VETDSSSFFAVPLSSLCRILTNLWVKYNALQQGMLIIFCKYFFNTYVVSTFGSKGELCEMNFYSVNLKEGFALYLFLNTPYKRRKNLP